MAYENEHPQKLAILIDADNASPGVAKGLLEEVASIGEASEAPRHFVEIAREVLGADIVMDADDLALQERPNAFDAVGVDGVMPNILPCAVIDAVVVVIARQPDE